MSAPAREPPRLPHSYDPRPAMRLAFDRATLR